jgi:uncharacterized membrane protein YdbT with pleckstrin-like domain
MKSYVKKSLAKDETLVANPKESKWFLVMPYVYGLGLAPFTFGASLLIIVIAHLMRWSTEYAITDKKVLCKRGIVARKTDELLMKKVEGVDVKQGFWARIFGHGTIVFTGTGSQTVVFKWVPNPVEVKNQITALI